jgi:hypothetical protein
MRHPCIEHAIGSTAMLAAGRLDDMDDRAPDQDG